MTDWPRIADTAEELLAEARAAADVDIDDEDAAEPVQVLIDSYNESARFAAEAAVMKRRFVVRVLTNRLRMLRDLAAHPEILDIHLIPPVIIHTMPRTGSTKLQKALASTGEVNWLPYWMTLNYASVSGVPGEDTSWRIADVVEYATWCDERSPETRFGHHMQATEPEEEAVIMQGSLLTPSFSGFAACDSYLAWLATCDPTAQFRYVRDVLKYLIWQELADPAKPFVLKCVVTPGYDSAMRAVYPDATVVALHRSPFKFVPSAAKLGQCFHRIYSDQPRRNLARTPERSASRIHRSLDYREANPHDVFHDVSYADVRADSVDVARRIFGAAGIECGRQAFDNVAKWEADHPQRRGGTWAYAPEDFGFTNADIADSFERYIAWVADRGIADYRTPDR